MILCKMGGASIKVPYAKGVSRRMAFLFCIYRGSVISQESGQGKRVLIQLWCALVM